MPAEIVTQTCPAPVCNSSKEDVERFLEELTNYMEQFEPALQRVEQLKRSKAYVHGLLGNATRKNVEQMALGLGEKVRSQQYFVGQSPWEAEPVIGIHQQLVGETLESARGIKNAYEIASASPLVEAFTFGGEEFTQDIGATRTREGREIFAGRSLLVIAAKAAGVQALDTVFSDFNDMEGLRQDTLAVKQMGFDGRAAIHPSQIEVIHEIFTPTAAEIQHAVNVIHGAQIAREKGSGVAVVKGKMIDKPIIERAEKILRIAERLDLPIPEPEGE